MAVVHRDAVFLDGVPLPAHQRGQCGDSIRGRASELSGEVRRDPDQVEGLVGSLIDIQAQLVLQLRPEEGRGLLHLRGGQPVFVGSFLGRGDDLVGGCPEDRLDRPGGLLQIGEGSYRVSGEGGDGLDRPDSQEGFGCVGYPTDALGGLGLEPGDGLLPLLEPSLHPGGIGQEGGANHIGGH